VLMHAWRASTARLLGPWQGSSRCFGVEKQIKKLRLSGAVKHAFRQTSPPQLPKQAMEHYVRDLGRHGGEKASLIRSEAAKEPAPLTSEQKIALLQRYLPEEEDMSKKLRKNSHKWLWRFLRRRDWRRFEVCLERLRERDIQFDEVTYNFAMYGLILHPKKDDELAHQVFDEMKDDGRFHPALLRMQQGFLDSYFELKEVDATPNRFNLLKVTRTFWQISVNFKRLRVKETKKRLAAAAEQERERLAASGLLLEEPSVYRDEAADTDGELSDLELGPRVKWPARRPYQMKNVHKGSGVPHRKKHRWKH